jgi:hypothetical protein
MSYPPPGNTSGECTPEGAGILAGDHDGVTHYIHGSPVFWKGDAEFIYAWGENNPRAYQFKKWQAAGRTEAERRHSACPAACCR